jgi:hypothetical protein
MLIESKSNLAKLMATENLVVEQRNIPTAYFNMSTRTLVIPTLKEELNSYQYDLFIGHEVGHALNTPPDGWHDSVTNLGVNRSILNVCEDIRIEKLIRRKYPGLRPSFVKAYRELLDQNFFGTDGLDMQELKFIDRVNLHSKCGASLGINFDLDELPLLRLAEDAETFNETVHAAKKIQQFMKEQLEEQKKEEQEARKQKGGKGETPEEKGEGPSNSKESTPDEEDVTQSEGGVGGTNSDTPDTPDVEKEETVEVTDEELESDTDNAFREKEKELYDHKHDGDYTYATVPNLNADNLIVDYKTIYNEIREISASIDEDDLPHYLRHAKIDNKVFVEFRKESNKVVSYLAKEFELRKNAEQMKKASVAKTGDLNMNRIFSYQFSEDIFKKISIVPNGKSHGLVLFLDWSGSMDRYMHETIKQLMTLVLFCKKVSIPFDVYAFSDQYKSKGDWDESLDIKYESGDLILNHLSLLNILSSRMNSHDFSYAGATLLSKIYTTGYYINYRLGGTPLNETIIAAMDIVPKFQKKYKLQVVNTTFLTDGEGHSLSTVQSEMGRKRTYKTIVRDPKTSASMKYELRNSHAFLFLLKQRAHCNVIGFRIIDPRNFKNQLYSKFPSDVVDRLTNDFRKNNYLVSKEDGFDENYMLRADKMNTDDDDEFEVKSTTTRGLVTAFKTYTKGHIQNRMVLNRFIDLIS